MKKMFKTILPGLALMLFVISCDKYEGPDLMDRAPATMDNTSWVYVIKDSVSVTTTNLDGEEETRNVDRTISNYLLFETKTVGTVKTEIVSKMYPKMNKDSVADFRYDYTMPMGVVHSKLRDAYGYENMYDIPFEVTGKKLMIDWGNGLVVYDRRIDL